MPTLSRAAIVTRIEASGLVAIIRADAGEVGPGNLVDCCQALRDGGVDACEITMTSPGALEAIAKASASLGDSCLVGVGSVLDAQTARAAIMAGARFMVSPVFKPEVLQTAHRYGLPAMLGALTPTEMLTAWEAGADVIKVFPAGQVGPKFLKDVLAPMPMLKLMPTGGVELANVAEWIQAGAAVLGAGASMVRKDLIKSRDWASLTALAKQYVAAVRQARGE